jgi:hypothetical protein
MAPANPKESNNQAGPTCKAKKLYPHSQCAQHHSQQNLCTQQTEKQQGTQAQAEGHRHILRT